MLMVLTVSTNHIRKELCHCAIIGIMQIVTRQHFVITTLIHKFPLFFIISSVWGTDRLFIIYAVFIIFCHHLVPLLLCRLVNRRTCKNKCILLNSEQGNKVNSQRSFSCISVDFSGEDQPALFPLPPDSIHSCAAVKLGSEETEEKSIRVSVLPLIFSLLPPFSPHLHHPVAPPFLGLAFSVGPWWPIHPHALHWPGQDIEYPMDSHFLSLPSHLHPSNTSSNPPTPPLCSLLSSNLTSISPSSSSLLLSPPPPSLSLHSVMLAV